MVAPRLAKTAPVESSVLSGSVIRSLNNSLFLSGCRGWIDGLTFLWQLPSLYHVLKVLVALFLAPLDFLERRGAIHCGRLQAVVSLRSPCRHPWGLGLHSQLGGVLWPACLSWHLLVFYRLSFGAHFPTIAVNSVVVTILLKQDSFIVGPISLLSWWPIFEISETRMSSSRMQRVELNCTCL